MMLWAWQRPEDLRFLNPLGTGVAHLVETLWLSGDSVRVELNFDPLIVPVGTWLMGCVRIEVDPLAPARLSPAQLKASVAALLNVARAPGISGLQIDFDATYSQRGFYRRLLSQLRHRLSPAQPLSMTALVSWCGGESWLADLPVDEIVPMYFNMGPTGPAILRRVDAMRRLPEPRCNGSVGISLGSPMPRLPDAARRYIFDNDSWSQNAWSALKRELPREVPR